jgi:hypothetical protein
MAQKANSQKHKILRQVVEVSGCPANAQKRLQSLLSATYHKKLVPLIDQICSDLSTSEQIHRIEHLEIDLGKLTLDNLEISMVESFEKHFKETLVKAVRNTSKADADLELFVFFIHNGSLPWWADNNDPELLSKNLSELTQKKPRAIQSVLKNIAEPEKIWQRIVRTYPDRVLDELIYALLPGAWSGATKANPKIGASWLSLLQNSNVVNRNRSGMAYRQLFWQHALQEAIAYKQDSPSAAPDFYRILFSKLAQALGRDYDDMIAALERTLSANNASLNPWVRKMVSLLKKASTTKSGHAENRINAPQKVRADMHDLRTYFAAAIKQLEHSAALDAIFWKSLRELIEKLPENLRIQMLQAFHKAQHETYANQKMKTASSARITLLELLKEALAAELSAIVKQLEQADTLTTTLRDTIQKFAEQLPDALKIQISDMLQKAVNEASSESRAGAQTAQAILIKQLRDILAQHRTKLFRSQEPDKSPIPHSTPPSNRDFLSVLEHLEGTHLLSTVQQNQLYELIRKLPDAFRDRALELFYRLDSSVGNSQRSKTDSNTASSAKKTLIALMRKTLVNLSDKSAEKKPDPIDLSFSKTDAFYIDNAGLVILWPFFSHFFKHMGFIEKNPEKDHWQFTDETLRHRAVGLLQYLVNEDESPQEVQLPLNKILCGMETEDVFALDSPINDQEKKECNNLLTAVIRQIPILKNMSHAGFRNSFLLRQGQLSVFDDRWLLRAEQETHDIVLNRFPWGFSTVKLPWMTTIIQVDW